MLLLFTQLFGCQDNGFTVHDTEPTADIVSPVEGAQLRVGAEILLSGLVHDDQTTDTSQIVVSWLSDLDPQPVTGETAADGTTTATWTPTVPGNYELILHASADAVEGADSVNVVALSDDAPVVTWDSPAMDAAVDASAPPDLVASVADDFDAVTSLTLAWTVNDTPLADCPTAPSADGSMTCSPGSLPVGALVVCVNAMDTAGSVGTACVRLGAEDCSASTWYADTDGDGFGNPAASSTGCDAPAGFVADFSDCDDTLTAVNPDAAEVCDTLDNDCDGDVDEDSAIDAPTWYADVDADGYGDDASTTVACAAPAGSAAVGGDCDDADSGFHPGATEADCADPNDYNCDGSVGYADADGDGYAACEECDDADGAVSPAGTEVCDGVDNDCDGTTDDASASDADTWYADTDGDGYGDATLTVLACSQPAAYVADSSDCDDADGAVSPAAAERCDGADNDCDGETDEDSAIDVATWYADVDGDGFGDGSVSFVACDAPTGAVADATDCDDAAAAVNPGETELCNGGDDDCDGATDEADAADAGTWYADSDGDGFGDATLAVTACDAPADFVADAADCDDADAGVSPDALELCDGADDDCDGLVDEASAIDASTWYADTDGDGFGDGSVSSSACSAPASFVADSSDCDDLAATVNPTATERCDSVDNDCDGAADESSAVDAATWYADADGDGFGDPGVSAVACDVPASFVADSDDCDDGDASVSPAGTELCDGVDNDCNGYTDEDAAADALTWYADGDGDTYGDAAATSVACTRPGGFVADADDCDDTDSAVSPAGTERCDSVDNDCDGTVDEDSASDALTWYADVDGDGFGDTTVSTTACDAPASFVADSDDCDDADAGVSPAGTERCDGLDNDCDGAADESSAVDVDTWYADADGDGYGDAAVTAAACSAPPDYVADSSDCDDADAAVNPAATELCDALDNDCNGVRDDASAADAGSWYGDADGDGYGDASLAMTACEAPYGYVGDSDDCDDTDAAVSPAATEVCDSQDNDCDGLEDESSATDATLWYADADADSYGDPNVSATACTAPADYVADNDDCDDTDAAVNPDGAEVCDGADNDCDGSSDWDYAVPANFSTVASAVAGAPAGTTVCVAAGTYSGQITMSRAVIIEGYDGSDVTFLDGGASGVVLTASSFSGTGEVHGVTIQNGSATSGAGVKVSSAALWLEDVVIAENTASGATSGCTGGALYGSSATIEMSNVDIRDNSASCSLVYGGLMYLTGSTVTADNLRMVDNDATAATQLAPGLFLSGSTFTGTNVIFAGNYAEDNDGAVWMMGELFTSSASTLVLTNATITGNTMEAGAESVTGTVHLYSATDRAIFTNVALTDNVYSGSTINSGGVFSWSTPTFSSTYSDYYSNTSANFYGVSDPSGTSGNVSVAPRYTDVTAADAADWDLTLQAASPLVDAGSPALSDPDGTSSDIGAWGGPGAANW